MKLAVNGKMDAEHLAFARQLGVTDMVNRLPDCDLAKGYYDFHDLSLQKARIEDAGRRARRHPVFREAWQDQLRAFPVRFGSRPRILRNIHRPGPQ